MSKGILYLMSPREPSGATWLINCFLELGIKTYRERQGGLEMWKKNGDVCTLNGYEEILKKWLPALWDHKEFNFREDLEVIWAHNWPSERHKNNRIVFFARDPRDSLYSRYKREAPDQTFDEFLMFPDVNTLLDKAHNWRLFNHAWMQHPNYKLFRFEDYKKNALSLLIEILEFMGLVYSSSDLNRAISASTFERAAEAEVKYRLEHPEDKELINRSGTAGEWRQGLIEPGTIGYIEKICGDVMQRQGYNVNVSVQIDFNYAPLLTNLPFFKDILLPVSFYQKTDGKDISEEACAFAKTLDYDRLSRASLRQYEVNFLLKSLTILLQAKQISSQINLAPLFTAFGLTGMTKMSTGRKVITRIKSILKKIIQKVFPYSAVGN